VFPQCRILADAYRGAEPDGDPRDHDDIRAPMPLAIDRAIVLGLPEVVWVILGHFRGPEACK